MPRYTLSIDTAGGSWTAGWSDSFEEMISLLEQYASRKWRIWDKTGRWMTNDGVWMSTFSGLPWAG